MEEVKAYVAIIFYAFGSLAGIIVTYFTYKIYRIKFTHEETVKNIAETEEKIATIKLKALTEEAINRIEILKKTTEITGEISHCISEKLIENPSWLDRFMDQTGVTYSASVYGKRIGHFYYEKAKIAKGAIDRVEEKMKTNQDTRYCLIIDSGTTMYPVFQEITNRLRDKEVKELWKERICVVTNNIPGMQYLMKNAKEDPNNEYSEVAISCYIMPGKPLSVYAAITGAESVKWLGNIGSMLKESQIWKNKGSAIRTIGFVTGNYMAKNHSSASPPYLPVARGEGHIEIKNKIVEVSDELFLLSPLMKFTFASVGQLNRVNGFNIDRHDKEAQQTPNLVKYEEVLIPESMPTSYFSTKRPKGATFQRFGEDLYNELCEQGDQCPVSMQEFDIRYWSQAEGDSHLELEKEIPHKNLRKQYEQENNIWDKGWVREHP